MRACVREPVLNDERVHRLVLRVQGGQLEPRVPMVKHVRVVRLQDHQRNVCVEAVFQGEGLEVHGKLVHNVSVRASLLGPLHSTVYQKHYGHVLQDACGRGCDYNLVHLAIRHEA